MIRSLYSAASGMISQQTSLDVIANNLANANTVGYKRDRMDQVDLAYQPFKLPARQTGEIGLGAAPGRVGKETAQGIMQNTERPLDVSIGGEGYFVVTRPNGQIAYTRAGNLQVDANGSLGLPSGELFQPRITVPANATGFTVGQDGTVTATVNGEITRLGQIRTATFANPAGLSALGGNLFTPTANSGTPQVGAPGSGDRGIIAQGVLEASNVQIATEMINMITTQRAFEASSRVVQASDQMWGIANGLRR